MKLYCILTLFAILSSYGANATNGLSIPLVNLSGINPKNTSTLANPKAFFKLSTKKFDIAEIITFLQENPLDFLTKVLTTIVNDLFPFVDTSGLSPIDFAALGIPFFPGICQSPLSPAGVGFNTISCNYDCIQQHGADCGWCTSGTSCNCNYINETGYDECLSDAKANFAVIGENYRNPFLNLKTQNEFAVQQCYSGGKNGYGIEDIYSSGCFADCVCNHGAINGTCNYEKEFCECEYPGDYNPVNGTDPKCTESIGFFKNALLNAVKTFTTEDTYQKMLCNSPYAGNYKVAKFNSLHNLFYVNNEPTFNYTVNSTEIAITCYRENGIPVYGLEYISSSN